MRKSVLFLFLMLAFSGFGLSAGVAGDKIFVGLYLAQNTPPPSDAKLAPDGLHHRLHEVFGFKHYQVVKLDQMDLHKEWEQWFVPRKDFFLRIEPLHHQEGEPKVIDYEIYKDGFIVAKGKYEPREGTPLFINGPDFQSGRFIFVVSSHPQKGEWNDAD